MYKNFYTSHLTKSKILNSEIVGLCPFHDDKKPSFYANIDTGQAHCFGCQWKGNALSFSKALNIPLNEVPGYNMKKDNLLLEKKIETTYNYCDEKGEILYQVVRYKPKDFRIRRPDGNGDWIWNLNGTRKVLYRLPQILDSGQLLIVEGEKDADMLIDAGFAATTCVGGANKWRSEYNEWLRDKDLALIPHKDTVGMEHSYKIADSLNEIAKSIKIVKLPDLVGEKGDVFDFLKQKTPEDLIQLIDSEKPISKDSCNVRQLKTNNIEEFPDIYDGVAGKYAELYSNYLEAPKHFFYMCFLTCLGSILSDKVMLKGELKEQPRFYVVLLGESADVRKSTAIDKTIAFFKDTVLNISEELNICRMIGSAEGLQHRLNDTKNNNFSKKLLLCLDEFKAFLNKCSISSSVLLQCVNSLFHMNEYENHTKTTNLSLKNVYLSILAAPTTNTYKNAWSPVFTDIGFNNRLFIVPGEANRKYSIPREIPHEKKNEIKIELGGILNLVENNRLEMDITSEAKVVYDDWYHNMESSLHSKRLDTYALRLMPILTLNEGKKIIDDDVIKKVIAICNWQFRMRQVYDPIDADNEIAKMEERIRRQLKSRGPIRESMLKKALHTERKQHGFWVYKKAIENLNESEEIGKNKKGEWELKNEF